MGTNAATLAGMGWGNQVHTFSPVLLCVTRHSRSNQQRMHASQVQHTASGLLMAMSHHACTPQFPQLPQDKVWEPYDTYRNLCVHTADV
jgi:hypothetical protein